jgi:redox-sensitive bicupin YhaK (pirin superfamily)
MLRDGGLMHGLQLWVNLPRAEKLVPPAYQDLDRDKITYARTAEYNALVYVLGGKVRVADDSRQVGVHQLAVLTRDGDTLAITADEDADVLVLGGRPLREPVAWYGPFVMNTKQEILDSLDLYERGELGSIPPRVG